MRSGTLCVTTAFSKPPVFFTVSGPVTSRSPVSPSSSIPGSVSVKVPTPPSTIVSFP